MAREEIYEGLHDFLHRGPRRIPGIPDIEMYRIAVPVTHLNIAVPRVVLRNVPTEELDKFLMNSLDEWLMRLMERLINRYSWIYDVMREEGAVILTTSDPILVASKDRLRLGVSTAKAQRRLKDLVHIQKFVEDLMSKFEKDFGKPISYRPILPYATKRWIPEER